MQNPMLKGLNQSQIMNNLAPIKNLMNTVKMAQNPMALLSQNPQLKQVVDYVNQNGGNAKEVFYKLADEQGINPNDILNQLR